MTTIEISQLKDFIAEQFAAFRVEMDKQFAAFRVELRADIKESKNDVVAMLESRFEVVDRKIATIHVALSEIRNDLDDATERVSVLIMRVDELVVRTEKLQVSVDELGLRLEDLAATQQTVSLRVHKLGTAVESHRKKFLILMNGG